MRPTWRQTPLTHVGARALRATRGTTRMCRPTTARAATPAHSHLQLAPLGARSAKLARTAALGLALAAIAQLACTLQVAPCARSAKLVRIAAKGLALAAIAQLVSLALQAVVDALHVQLACTLH